MMKYAVPENGIAREIVDSVRSLLESRRRLGGRFTDNDEIWGAGEGFGAYASMQGIRTILGAFAALAEERAVNIWEAIEADLPSIFDEWRDVLGELERDGYGARPYDRTNGLLEILREGRLKRDSPVDGYVDTLSWTVSTAVLFNHTARILQGQRRPSPSSELLDETRLRLGAALTQIIDAQCDDGGWAWSRGADEGHLYFTWSTVQCLADLYDYVYGESFEQIGVPVDHEVTRWLEASYPDLRHRTDAARRRAVDFLVKRFLAKELREGLDFSDVTIDRRVEPLDRDHARVILYYELYLLEALILLGYDLSENGSVIPSRRDELSQVYRKVIGRFDEIRALPSSDAFWDDPNASTLRFKVLSRKVFQTGPHSFVVQDPGLWAQSLRSMILYRFYTDPQPEADREIVGAEESALRFLLDDRRDRSEEIGESLWDQVAFNLSITARSIESLIDVYDYYNLLARSGPPVPSLEGKDSLSRILADAVFPHVAARLAVAPPSLGESGPSESIGTGDVKKLLGGYLLKDSFGEQLVALLGDALFPFNQSEGPSANDLMTGLLGKKEAEHLEGANPDAYRVLGRLASLVFITNVRLWHVILSEAMVFNYQGTANQAENEEVRRFRQLESDDNNGRQSLPDRVRLALKEMLGNELNSNPASPPSYNDVIKVLFSQSSPSKSKGR